MLGGLLHTLYSILRPNLRARFEAYLTVIQISEPRSNRIPKKLKSRTSNIRQRHTAQTATNVDLIASWHEVLAQVLLSVYIIVKYIRSA